MEITVTDILTIISLILKHTVLSGGPESDTLGSALGLYFKGVPHQAV